ncbi:MAG: SAM-dependent methyltransferase [Clostridia bacterium]|nr:SAM-dependent methyltransferase [Clostridia bacterium]
MSKLTLRLKTLLDELSPCQTFADVGCDHGYIAENMLKSGKCEFAYVTDVSPVCLQKAVDLLSSEYKGRFKGIVCDGLQGVPKVDQALIAGMGGELICDILSRADFLPERIVLQPMKNAEKVREKAVKSGYKLIKDYTFVDEKFYDVIVCERGKDSYTQDELTFGRDNLRYKNPAFRQVIEKKIQVLKTALPNMTEIDSATAKKQIEKYTEILNK